MTDLLESNHYLIRKELLKFLGKIHIYSDDNQEDLIGYSYQKALKLKDIRVYTDESETEGNFENKG